MEIKTREGFPLRIFFARFKKRKILFYGFILIVLVFLMGLSFFAGQKYKEEFVPYRNSVFGVVRGNFNFVPNYIKGFFSETDKLSIDVAHIDWQRLAFKRQEALERGVLSSNDEDFVSATFNINGKTMDGKIRLKGDDALTNLEGDKWSLRVDLRGENRFRGMEEFSLQHPKVKSFVHEWIFHEALKREEILSVVYDFVEVTINGENKGVYALEGTLDKNLIESSGNREGVLLRFDEDLFWQDRDQFDRFKDSFTGIRSLQSAYVDVFNKNQVFSDSVLSDQYEVARNLLENFRDQKLTASQVFDIDKMAKFVAVSSLMATHNGLHWHNLRFYYNPITSKIEPVGFDGHDLTNDPVNGIRLIRDVRGSVFSAEKIIKLERNEELREDSFEFLPLLFADVEFMRAYNKEVERMSQKSYVDEMFKDLGADLDEKLDIIHKSYPFYYFSSFAYYDNQEFINEFLKPAKGLHAFFVGLNGRSLSLELGAIQALPLEVLGLKYNEEFFELDNEIILQSKVYEEAVNYKELIFNFPVENAVLSNIKVVYKVLGTDEVREDFIFPWRRVSEGFGDRDLVRQGPNLEGFNFLEVNENEIRIKSGEWRVERDLIIPSGFKVIGEGAIVLDLVNNANIVSYSGWDLRGNVNNPIRIQSSDGTGGGFVVFEAEESSLVNVVFDNLNAVSSGLWSLTGGVNFFENKVVLDNVQFLNGRGEDVLNIIRSGFEIRNSLFENSFSDCFDGDFVKGQVSNTQFINCGNDGIDFSGSEVKVLGVVIMNAGDKGVSIGEKSKVEIDNVEIETSFIGVASKDVSEVNVENVKIRDSEYALAVYKKKAEFGPSKINVKVLELENNVQDNIVEVDSSLIIENKEIGEKEAGVYSTLYPLG